MAYVICTKLLFYAKKPCVIKPIVVAKFMNPPHREGKAVNLWLSLGARPAWPGYSQGTLNQYMA